MKKRFVCTVCGHVGTPKNVVKGSMAIELVLWLFFIVPGLIYSIWRLTTKYQACPKCESGGMIPEDTPRAREILSDNEADK